MIFLHCTLLLISWYMCVTICNCITHACMSVCMSVWMDGWTDGHTLYNGCEYIHILSRALCILIPYIHVCVMRNTNVMLYSVCMVQYVEYGFKVCVS